MAKPTLAVPVLFAITLFASSVAFPQDLPEAPKANSRTFTVTSSIEMALAGAALSADGYSSYKIQNEINPIARPFVTTTGGTSAYFGGSFVGLLYANHLLRNHPRWRHIMNWSVIGVESAWAAHNFSSDNQRSQQAIVTPPPPPHVACQVCGTGF